MTEHHPFLTPSPHEADGGNLIGRDPRDISANEWQEHMPDAVIGLKAIRAKCIECCNGNGSEVRKCVCTECPLWPLRMGTQPKALREVRSQAKAK